MSPEFLLTSLIIVATPGTGVVYTLSTALTRGARASLAAAFGCTLGILPHLIAAMAGLAALMQTSALVFESVKYLGVAYLLFMAWNAMKETGSLTIVTEAQAQSLSRIIGTAILVNILNPKLSIFFLAFLPQFVKANDPHALSSMLSMSAVFMAMTFVVFAIYGLFAASVRDRIVSRPSVMAWLRRSFAAAFVALGVKLALSQK
jgi:threonine/homoserine/homoserine lactone efflux protein